MTLASCWSHLRRKFYVGGHSPIGTQALLRIKEFHAVEDEARGLSPELRKRARQDRSKAIVEALKPWFDRSLTAVPRGGKIGEALAYGLNHWDGLTRFLDDGRIEIDSNTVECAMPHAIGNCATSGRRQPPDAPTRRAQNSFQADRHDHWAAALQCRASIFQETIEHAPRDGQ